MTPHAIPGLMSAPTVQVSQVGYHPKQQKWAIVEIDPRDTRRLPVVVSRIAGTGRARDGDGGAPAGVGPVPPLRLPAARLHVGRDARHVRGELRRCALESVPDRRGRLRAPRLAADGRLLPAGPDVPRARERALPRVARRLPSRRRADGAGEPQPLRRLPRRAPRRSRSSRPGEPVPGLDRGGWHDAGDDDLRVESQADTMHGLALAWEAFRPTYDDTTIDQKLRVVEMHQPDGKPDVLQQIEHGALTVVGGYRTLGRFYRGIISPTLRQYTHLGDFAAQTDGVVYDPKTAPAERAAGRHRRPGLARRPLGLHRAEPAAGAGRRGGAGGVRPRPARLRRRARRRVPGRSRRRSGTRRARTRCRRRRGRRTGRARGSDSRSSCCSRRGTGATPTTSSASGTRS